MFSKACEYAIRSCIYIASVSIQGKRVGLIDVAEKIQSPEAFTSKILQKLVTVSYTHLDVYKRQPTTRLSSFFTFTNCDSFE